MLYAVSYMLHCLQNDTAHVPHRTSFVLITLHETCYILLCCVCIYMRVCRRAYAYLCSQGLTPSDASAAVMKRIITKYPIFQGHFSNPDTHTHIHAHHTPNGSHPRYHVSFVYMYMLYTIPVHVFNFSFFYLFFIVAMFVYTNIYVHVYIHAGL